ncbi:MAG: helix-turn-helix transcriptional regulator [Eubacterium sp.]|nr:helix-turn-helix transcriptional regulator [Eubacterium sp.]
MIDIIFVQTDTSHPVGFECDMGREHDWWLFVQTHIQTYFVIDGKRIVMPAHAAILYPPHSFIQYGAAEKKIYSDDWTRFYTDEPFICKGNIPLETPFQTRDYMFIKQLLHLLACENFFDNKYKESSIQALFQLLFSKLHESLSSDADDFRELELLQLHMNIQNNPASPWSVPEMAKQLHICPRHLQKIYQKRFGITCMDDVIQNRLLLAKEKLEHTDIPVYRIAEQCGYSNTEHFSRQFKQHFTMSPSMYRRSKKNPDS